MNPNENRYASHTGTDKIVDLRNSSPQITCIGAKAFLSCKHIEKLLLPSSLSKIEDWGLAHTKNLRELCLPTNDIDMGKQVFLGCDRLSIVTLQNDNDIINMLPGLNHFIATSLRFFPELSRLNFSGLNSPSGQIEYLKDYDRRLIDYVYSPDDSNYVPAFIGWFDVADLDVQKAKHMEEARLNKILLVYDRLKNNISLDSNSSEKLQDYIRLHSDFIFSAVLDKLFPQKLEPLFFKIWYTSGGLTSDKIKTFLDTGIPEDIEIRHQFIEYQTNDKNDCFSFDTLEL